MYWGLLRELRYTFIFHLSFNDYSHAKSDTREQSVCAAVGSIVYVEKWTRSLLLHSVFFSFYIVFKVAVVIVW
jgi:hypothetical protein